MFGGTNKNISLGVSLKIAWKHQQIMQDHPRVAWQGESSKRVYPESVSGILHLTLLPYHLVFESFLFGGMYLLFLLR